MNGTLKRTLLRDPLALGRSLMTSRWAQTTGRSALPIIVSRNVRLELARGARIETEGNTVIDYQHFAGSSWLGELPAGPAIVRLIDSSSRLRLGAGVHIGGGTQIVVGPGGTIEVGSRSSINPNSRILCAHSIVIGCDCAISWRVTIFDFIGGHAVRVDGRELDDVAPVIVEDRVLVGAGATILRGVRVGEGAVIGAGSIVTADVPPGALVAGNPARVVSHDVSWSI
ncbi:MAG TPA: acyltransferase [Gaiellaceae bacterium]|jgi:acetyltransferase-like isoleucine patch superfamily enzyme|nr:acyltransferase [Gaiellaceae bacterium]